MATVDGIQRQASRRRLIIPIGMRLLLAFQVMILLTGLIGFLAMQQFNSLTAITTELNTHDLPEVITLSHIRTLLFQERDQELNLVYSNTPNATLFVSLNGTLQKLASQRVELLKFEPSDGTANTVADTLMIHTLTDGITQAAARSLSMQSMVKQQQFTQARLLQNKLQIPLLTTILGISARLRTLEQQEAAATASQVSHASSQATMFILGLTASALLLSLILALVITRSLTRPLSRLLVATNTIADGNLDYEAHIIRRDEIGRLAESFEKMRLNLRSTIAMLGREQRRTQAVIDASADGVILVDASLRVLQCNPSAERLSGLLASDARGKRWCELFVPEPLLDDEDKIHGTTCSLCRSLYRDDTTDLGESFSMEIDVMARNGQHHWFAVSSSPLTGDEERTQERQFVINVHDITQLKAVEQIKTDFVAMVSHELRAPVTTVTGSVEMLNILDPQADQEAYHEVLDILKQQTRRLRSVVQEVLQLTQFEAGRLPVRLQPLPLIAFVQTLVTELRQEWASNGRTVIFTAGIEETLVWADRNMLEIIVRNLLDNACKYTPSDSSVTLSLLPTSDPGEVQLRIDDQGPGIPKEQLESIFERFSRGTHTSSNWNRGYGLGLYIARELTRAHNGSIWAENRAEGGASFNLCLRITDRSFVVDEDSRREAKAETEWKEQTTYERSHPTYR